MRARSVGLAVLCAAAAHATCGGHVLLEGCGGQVETRSGGGAPGTGAAGGSGGAAADFTVCSAPGQCLVLPEDCCGDCGAATPGNMVGVHEDMVAQYDAACAGVGGCLMCWKPPDPSLFAHCVAGHCAAEDVRVGVLSACGESSDCRLRWGLGCCEGCGLTPEEELVAIAATALEQLESLVCDQATACAQCVVSYPPDAATACVAGHCAIAF